jgi:hypothetical protein
MNVFHHILTAQAVDWMGREGCKLFIWFGPRSAPAWGCRWDHIRGSAGGTGPTLFEALTDALAQAGELERFNAEQLDVEGLIFPLPNAVTSEEISS